MKIHTKFREISELLERPTLDKVKEAKDFLRKLSDYELKLDEAKAKQGLLIRVESELSNLIKETIRNCCTEIRQLYLNGDYEEVDSKIRMVKLQFGKYITKSSLEFMNQNRVARYHGVELTFNDVSALLELESILGKPIPLKADNPSFGYTKEGIIVIKLGLYEQGLSSLPECVSSIQNLRVLYLDNNVLISLPESISSLHDLEWFSLSRNQLTSLPEGISALKNLQKLFLNNNSLSFLPKDFSSLESLKILYLDKNTFSSFPECLLSLQELEKLDLSGNHLSSLPEKFSSLKNLQQLGLANNEITSLPISLVLLQKLKSIQLKNNQLSSLSEETKDVIQSLQKNGCTIDIFSS